MICCFYSDHFVLPLPAGHPFPMDKYRQLRERVAGWPRSVFSLHEAPMASEGELKAIHGSDYVDQVLKGTLPQAVQRRIGFPWSPFMAERARRSVGATLAAAQQALAVGVGVNLAGGTHHAHADRGGGYCVFNDLAVTARKLIDHHGLTRIAVIDLDVHHGDGTASIFAHDPRVFTFSMHGERNYPAVKPPSDLDIPLPRGTGDEGYLAALAPALEMIVDDFRPELVLYQAGADPYRDDRLGFLDLSFSGLARRDRLVFSHCQRHGLPVVVTMGGGYARQIEDIVRIHANTIWLARSLIASG
jgi:acetoin utilization deacetylase AcuC-like enzyme